MHPVTTACHELIRITALREITQTKPLWSQSSCLHINHLKLVHSNLPADFPSSATDLTGILCCHQSCSVVMFSWGWAAAAAPAQGSAPPSPSLCKETTRTKCNNHPEGQCEAQVSFQNSFFHSRMINEGSPRLPSQLADEQHTRLWWREITHRELRNDVALGAIPVLLSFSMDMTPSKPDMENRNIWQVLIRLAGLLDSPFSLWVNDKSSKLSGCSIAPFKGFSSEFN